MKSLRPPQAGCDRSRSPSPSDSLKGMERAISSHTRKLSPSPHRQPDTNKLLPPVPSSPTSTVSRSTANRTSSVFTRSVASSWDVPADWESKNDTEPSSTASSDFLLPSTKFDPKKPTPSLMAGRRKSSPEETRFCSPLLPDDSDDESFPYSAALSKSYSPITSQSITLKPLDSGLVSPPPMTPLPQIPWSNTSSVTGTPLAQSPLPLPRYEKGGALDVGSYATPMVSPTLPRESKPVEVEPTPVLLPPLSTSSRKMSNESDNPPRGRTRTRNEPAQAAAEPSPSQFLNVANQVKALASPSMFFDDDFDWEEESELGSDLGSRSRKTSPTEEYHQSLVNQYQALAVGSRFTAIPDTYSGMMDKDCGLTPLLAPKPLTWRKGSNQSEMSQLSVASQESLASKCSQVSQINEVSQASQVSNAIQDDQISELQKHMKHRRGSSLRERMRLPSISIVSIANMVPGVHFHDRKDSRTSGGSAHSHASSTTGHIMIHRVSGEVPTPTAYSFEPPLSLRPGHKNNSPQTPQTPGQRRLQTQANRRSTHRISMKRVSIYHPPAKIESKRKSSVVKSPTKVDSRRKSVARQSKSKNKSDNGGSSSAINLPSNVSKSSVLSLPRQISPSRERSKSPWERRNPKAGILFPKTPEQSHSPAKTAVSNGKDKYAFRNRLSTKEKVEKRKSTSKNMKVPQPVPVKPLQEHPPSIPEPKTSEQPHPPPPLVPKSKKKESMLVLPKALSKNEISHKENSGKKPNLTLRSTSPSKKSPTSRFFHHHENQNQKSIVPSSTGKNGESTSPKSPRLVKWFSYHSTSPSGGDKKGDIGGVKDGSVKGVGGGTKATGKTNKEGKRTREELKNSIRFVGNLDPRRVMEERGGGGGKQKQPMVDKKNLGPGWL